jgi:group II intron reverse transcriptase/maturase
MAPMDHHACKALPSPSMLDILERSNMFKALKRVQSNKGCAGVDGMTVEELPKYLISEWPKIRESILNGTYSPNPVKIVNIPKPKGGTRMLGIPTVVDRLIQQAILQKLSPVFDKDFSSQSFGFRVGRNAHQAVMQALDFQKQGFVIGVDLDLEKFFDTVNHDRLMARLAKETLDKNLLLLIRRYLQSGMLTEGIHVIRDKGTPQGSPLSPFLSNIVLDELDKEIERRGHKFCRYADDCQIYVRSIEAGNRVYSSIRDFIERKLKLKVNDDKSEVDFAWRRSFLGYSFLGIKNPKLRCSGPTIERFKHNIRKLTRGHHRAATDERIKKLNSYIGGWYGYFKLSSTPRKFIDLDGWVRSRLRMCMFKRWVKPRTRVRELKKLGLTEERVGVYACSKKYWHLAQNPGSKFLMNKEYWEKTMGYRGLEWNMKRFVN